MRIRLLSVDSNNVNIDRLNEWPRTTSVDIGGKEPVIDDPDFEIQDRTDALSIVLKDYTTKGDGSRGGNQKDTFLRGHVYIQKDELNRIIEQAIILGLYQPPWLPSLKGAEASINQVVSMFK